jgi:NADH-quinone oxidoreductase subunit L
MFLAVGLGAFSAAIFHVFTHAFFKACLFLAAGSVIHALDGEQDMRKMGGLRTAMPTTYRTYVIAALAISGAPLTAGFFSKDLILWQAFSHGAFALWAIGWVTAGLTAFYMFRQLFMVFHGELRAGEHAKAHLHESPPSMTLPLVVLALGAIFSGWLNAPEYLWGSRWERWSAPIFGAQAAHHGEIQTEVLVTLATLVLAAVAVYLAYRRYGRSGATVAQDTEATGSALYRVLLNKYYIDELYDYAVVRPFTALSSWFARVFDPCFIDGIANGIAATARHMSLLWQRLQTGNVQHYLAGFLVGTLALLGYYMGQP